MILALYPTRRVQKGDIMKGSSAALVALIAAAPCALFTGDASADTRVSFETGVDYYSGDYGEAVATEVTSIPLIARVRTDDWSFRVSIPYLNINGPADVAEGTEGGTRDGGGAGAGVPLTRSGTETGFGDITLTATRSFRNLGGTHAYLDATGRVRLPTGDETRGLGVGTNDTALTLELGNSTSNGGVYGSLGKRFQGQRDGFDRQDVWQAGFGGWLRAGEHTRVGAYYSWREATISGNPEPSEAGAYISHWLNRSLRVTLNASGGFTDASPDYSAGVRLAWRSKPIGD